MSKISETAYRVVNMVLKVKESDVIAISGDILNGKNSDDPLAQIELLEELAMAIRKKKAYPVIDLSTERIMERFCKEIGPEVLSNSLDHYIKWISGIDYFIDLGWRNNPYLFINLTDSFFKLLQKHTNSLYRELKKQNKKILLMGYPTKTLSDFYSADYEVLKESYFSSINCDYTELDNVGRELLSLISKCKKYKLYTEETNLDFELNCTNYELYTGDISCSTETVLPAGKLLIPINQATLTGNIFIEKAFFENMSFDNIHIEFSHGKITSINIKSSQKGGYLLQNYLINTFSNTSFKNRCYLNLGFNKSLKNYTNYSLFDSCIYRSFCIHLINDNNKQAFLMNKDCKLRSQNGMKIFEEVLR